LLQFKSLPSGLRYWEKLSAEPTVAIIFIHGVGTSCDYWLEVAHALPDGVSAVGFDLPGSGKSPDPPKDDDFRILASFSLKLMKPIVPRAPQVVIVGHSLGSLIASQMVRQDPSVASLLILVDPVLFRAEGVLTHLTESIRNPRYLTLVLSQLGGAMLPGPWTSHILRNSAIRKIALAHQMGNGPDVDPSTLRRCLSHTRGWPSFSPIAVVRAARTVRMREIFSHVTVPVAVVKGERDPLTNEADLAELSSMCETLSVSVIPHAGHSPMLNLPKELITHILAAIERAAQNGDV